MSAIKRNCGNCKHSTHWSYTPTGRFARGTTGKCLAPVVVTQLPASIRALNEDRQYMQPGDGADCTSWEPKP